MRPPRKPQTPRREQFANGSSVLIYEDGFMAILETDLAKETALPENRPLG
jgi:hypothetical protein